MKCPECGADGRVVNTETRESEVIRYRRCVRCLCAWRTVERVERVTAEGKVSQSGFEKARGSR